MNDADKDTTIPLYEIVKRRISEAVLQGTLKAGDVLPGEEALSEQYAVAVGTVRRALADLTAEGMVTRRKRTGTVVTGRMPQHSMRFFYQYFRLHRSDGKLVRSATSVLSIKRAPASSDEATEFQIPPASAVIRIHRLKTVEGLPVMHETVVMPSSRMIGFPDRADDVPELIYVHLLERYDVRISAVRERVSAELASREDKTLLAIDRASAVLVVDARAYDQSDKLCIISKHRAATANFHYVNEIR